MGMDCEGFFSLSLQSNVNYTESAILLEIHFWKWGFLSSCFVTELKSRQRNEVVVFRIKNALIPLYKEAEVHLGQIWF